MAVKIIKPGVANIRLDFTLKANETPEQALEVPGGLYPMIARAYEIDEYRLLNGWPVPIPPMDIRCDTMVSADGEVITSRDDPTTLKTNALVRWVAHDDFYDTNALRWSPVENQTGQPVYWETSVFDAPVLINDYEYRVGSERFYRPALNFDSDNHNQMWADFSTTIGGASGYSVIFVMSPSSVFGNNLQIPYNYLWGPDGTTTHYMALSMQGRYLYLETEEMMRTRTISIAPGQDVAAPLMIGVVFDRPETTIYVGTGPSSIRVFSMPTGSVSQPMPDQYRLGGHWSGDDQRTADMALLDLGIYADRLTATQMADEFSLLSASYGGDV
jgi:hypothetical protein